MNIKDARAGHSGGRGRGISELQGQPGLVRWRAGGKEERGGEEKRQTGDRHRATSILVLLHLTGPPV